MMKNETINEHATPHEHARFLEFYLDDIFARFWLYGESWARKSLHLVESCQPVALVLSRTLSTRRCLLLPCFSECHHNFDVSVEIFWFDLKIWRKMLLIYLRSSTSRVSFPTSLCSSSKNGFESLDWCRLREDLSLLCLCFGRGLGLRSSVFDWYSLTDLSVAPYSFADAFSEAFKMILISRTDNSSSSLSCSQNCPLRLSRFHKTKVVCRHVVPDCWISYCIPMIWVCIWQWVFFLSLLKSVNMMYIESD